MDDEETVAGGVPRIVEDSFDLFVCLMILINIADLRFLRLQQ